MISAGEAVAVPSFSTTAPAAKLASRVAVPIGTRAASASVSTATTVSPAPLTSKTVRATDGMCSAVPSLPKSDMPSSPRVTST